MIESTYTNQHVYSIRLMNVAGSDSDASFIGNGVSCQ